MRNRSWVTAAMAIAALLLASVLTNASAPRAAAVSTGPIDITGVDLHDGMIYESGGTYYLVGTEYGCGFQWKQNGTPWCGYGVATASSPSGPWSTPTQLFSPSATDPYTGMTWAAEAGTNGWGMYVPRMVQRTGWGANDGVWILYFPDVYSYAKNGQSSYIAMGCNGPTGPCGYSAPYGTVHRIGTHQCNQDGDASFFVTNSTLTMVCTMANQTLSEEQLDEWGTTGTGTGATNLAGLQNVESSGVYQDPATGAWIMTYSDPNCGYCSGDGTGYATASNPLGPWTAASNPNPNWSAPQTGRRDLSATSCGGQPDTVVNLDGQEYEVIDLWSGTANETSAPLHLEPLVFNNAGNVPGQLWQPFAPWTCT